MMTHIGSNLLIFHVRGVTQVHALGMVKIVVRVSDVGVFVDLIVVDGVIIVMWMVCPVDGTHAN
jgi:hypothetical protein